MIAMIFHKTSYIIMLSLLFGLMQDPYPPNPTPLPVVTPVQTTPTPQNWTILLYPVYVHKVIRGVETWSGYAADAAIAPYLDSLLPEIVKMPLTWMQVEVAPGIYSWPQNMDASIKKIAKLGAVPYISIKGAPVWQLSPGSTLCGRPIDPVAFGKFAADVAERYSGKIYIELGNEPDIDVGEHNWYGCWANSKERYYGGEYYREILDASYSRIKSANPEAIVVAGAMAFPCLKCQNAEWIEGWISSPNYDAVSFHYYTWDLDTTPLLQRIAHIRKFTEKPVYLSETNALSNICDLKSEEKQALWANKIKSMPMQMAIWFFLPPDDGWHCTGMIRQNSEPKLSFEEWK